MTPQFSVHVGTKMERVNGAGNLKENHPGTKVSGFRANGVH